jgi:hypothetical protein
MGNSRSIAVYQPYFFPYLPYWQLLAAVDVFVIGDAYQYKARGFINRNTILLNHAPHRVTMSLKGASPSRRIGEIDVLDDFAKFRRTLAHAYGRAPFHADAMAVIDPILDHPDKNLARFLGNQVRAVSRYVGLSTEIVYMSELGLDSTCGSKEQRLRDCVKRLGAGAIINPAGSIPLYAPAEFEPHGIALRFLRPHAITYPQANREFVPGLSLIDAMMCNSRQSLAALLDSYDIIDATGAIPCSSG